MARSINPTTPTDAATLTLTIATNATGTSVLGAMIDGAVCQVVPGGSATPTATAAALAAVIAAALPAYTVSADAGVITVTAPNKRKIIAHGYSTDAAQTIAAAGGATSERVLSGASTAAAGKPTTGGGAGYALGDYVTRDPAGYASIVVRVDAVNVSGGAMAAYWQLWWWSPNLGWYVDPAVGVRLISDTTGTASGYVTSDVVPVSGVGTRCAVELIGKTSTGTALDSGESVNAWIEVI